MVYGYASKNLDDQRLAADISTDQAPTVQLEKEKHLLFDRTKTKVRINISKLSRF